MPDPQSLQGSHPSKLSHTGQSESLLTGSDSKTLNNHTSPAGELQKSGNSEYYQLNNSQNDVQQLREGEGKDRRYDSSSQRQVFHNTQQSFNEQQTQYTEQAFNHYAEQSPQQQTQHYDYEKTAATDEQIEQEFQRYHYQDGGNSQPGTGIRSAAEFGISALAHALESGLPSSDYNIKSGGDQIQLGAAETPDMMKLSQKIHQDRIQKDKLYGKLKETKTKSTRTSIESPKNDKANTGANDERLHDAGEEKTGRIKQDKRKRLLNKKGVTDDTKLHDAEKEKTDRIKQLKKKRLYDKNNIYDTEGAVQLDKAVDDVLDGKGRMRRGKRKSAEDEEDALFSRIVTKEHRAGRLKFENRITYEKLTKQEHDKKVREKDQQEFWDRQKNRILYAKAKSLATDDEIKEDETAGSYKRGLQAGYRAATYLARKNEKYLRDTYNRYARLQAVTERERYHMDKQKRLNARYDRQVQRDNLRNAATREERKRMKKEMHKRQVEKEGNFIRRSANQLKMTKRSVAHKQQTVKKTLKTIGAVCSIAAVFLGFFLILLLIAAGITHGSAEYYSTAVIQADYGDITEAAEYFRNLEADLDEYLSDRTVLEQELQDEYGPDIYEFNYDLAEFGHSANTIVAYVAARYGAFILDDTIKEDLKDIFQEMYTLNVETKMEYRDIEDTDVTDENGNHPVTRELKKICYVTLTKKELEEVVEPRLTEDQLKQYETYKLSTGGQQVYGPVMREDWSKKISSNYGDRIHPITKERKTHKGVDIAVPTGTKLYSAVKGTVTTARYSDTAGNMVTVQNDAGWSVTFMHMDSFAVSAGQEIQKGDFIGYSGNTGNSTGPHLHLQVNSPDGNTINPIFIIPQTCAEASGDEEEGGE